MSVLFLCLILSLLQAHALYDFEGQSGTGELTIRCGEVLTVLRKDVGEGWWEGTNSSGQSGLFPEAYVEVSMQLQVVTNRRNFPQD